MSDKFCNFCKIFCMNRDFFPSSKYKRNSFYVRYIYVFYFFVNDWKCFLRMRCIIFESCGDGGVVLFDDWLSETDVLSIELDILGV